ncbi:uncharacterized protein BT62DRAFT_1001654 [Guyanagaster necrorhizus]|uniref:UvrD-like helicase ATP-binding domain-containing protein n=1 Tax=Guyanagaster necrorhizus TaxID=856835 RepID=A0A9P7W2L8_9AGAR|nr:uncharacterized protein BT62DRAFT_1001654 [Guyanagaster necrorhizus MCA 3950]KAG7450840.1 hypothetical protein BT62DRAFT_1001654 [Guyanagaster necrorhizus MCA 3950]
MSPKQIYRSDLFTPGKLASAHLLDSALEELKGILTKHNFKHVFQDLLDNESPRVLLLVLSSLSETTPLISWLLESFPSEPANYDATVHYNIISRISIELISSSLIEEKEPCARYHEIAQIAPKVLQYLASFLRSINIRSDHRNKKGKAKQKKIQQAKREDEATLLVEKYFDVLNVEMPGTWSEASILMDHILQSQKDTLKFYLELLRRPEIYVSLKEHCIVSEEERIASGSVVESPSAYPIVQPMKALYFDNAEGFGKWTVIISTNADNFLRSTHKKDLYTFNITVKKIKELSCGHFTVNNQKRLSGRATEVPIFMAKVTCNLRLIVGHLFLIPDIADATLQYQIDTIPGDEKREQQALKIFGIYTHAQIDNRLWSSISSQLRKRGEEYRKRCAVRMPADSQASKNIFIPAFFPPLPEVSPSEIEDIPDLRPDETAQIHSRLVIEKYVTFSQPFLNTVLADVDATFPHMVSCATVFGSPCSFSDSIGTGKTTTMLFKMLLIERTFQLMESDLPRPRQVFITKSRILAKKVQEYFVKLSSSLTIASRPSVDLMNLPRAPQYQDDSGLIDVDDVVNWRTDLPAKYSDLKEKHFPLFITFDGLCDMLEADMGVQMLTATRHIGVKHNKSHMGVITFESFCESYWSHFPEPLVKELDPALVYSEIIGNIPIYYLNGLDLNLGFPGVIKGSAETLSEEKQHLSRAAYLDLSKRRHSTFADQRCEVYKLFELYTHKKKLRGEYDTADRTHSILKHFTKQGIPGQGLDHLYIDEVQDNMLIDTMVLRALCSNADGLFWAGDTAQTISVGSSFRFNALKAFQWNIEDRYRRKQGPRAGYKQPPEMFQLAINYRSHAGIVDCARSVIDLITTFWEDSIDHLSPEMGIVDGVKPMFFNDEDHAQLERFLFLDDGGSLIEFGSQQCIIVRNETAKKRLQEQVGEVGLVLTVYESKGLEFNDVLIYDFFADSPAGPAQWRVVLNAIKESKQDPRNTPQFDHIHHASICSELKCLYVAITRARANIWIADGSETGEPMRIFWTSKNLINNFTPGSDVPRLASESTPEEWAAEGRELFNAKHFSQAKHCYRKANLPLLASIADAYDLRMKARNVVGTSRQKVLERRSCFAEAAKSFSECANFTSNPRDSLTYLRISGECFEQADKKDRAAEKFLLAQEYTRAAELYRDIGKFDDAVAIVKAHEDEMPSNVVESVIKLARLAYFSGDRQMKKAQELFCSVEEEVEYLKDRDLDIALADLLETEGRLSEAAELHYVLRLMGFASWLDVAFMERTKADELSMFKAITHGQTSQLHELGLKFHKMGHTSAALLCLDQYFSQAIQIQNMALVDAVKELSMFYTYVDLLSATAFRTDPCGNAATAALFGFRRIAENEFLVPQNTWLHSVLLELRPRNLIRDSDSNLRLSVLELRGIFQDALRSRLRERTAAENDECARSKAFRPCLVFAVSVFCRRPECPEAHVSPSEIGPGYYNMRIRLHLQQILILQSLRENAHADVEHRGTKFWLNRLYEALYPPHHMFGSISHLALSTIPEAPKALKIVKYWVRTLVYGQTYHPQTTFLMDVMRTATLALTFDRSQAYYLRNAAYHNIRPPSVYIRRGDGLILHDLLSSMSGDRAWSLTAGFRFVEHVVEQRLPINIGDLCDFLDFLCGSVIFCGSRSGMRLPHNITVPRSWLLRFMNYDLPYFNGAIQTRFYGILLTPIWALLEQLNIGQDAAEHLLYGIGRNLSNVPYQVRHVFIARIIQTVGLLGYNIRNDFLRDDIRKMILSLRQEGRLSSPLYVQYIDAASHSWYELSKVIRLLEYNTMDEMIQLIHQSRAPVTVHTSPGVRPIVYNNFTDIRSQLGLIAPASTQTISSPTEVSEREEPDGDNDSDSEDAEDVQEAEVIEDTSDDDAVAVDAIPAHDTATPNPTERDIVAASLIQRVYRNVLRHRRGVAKRGTAGLHAQIYASCTEAVSRLGDNPGLYLYLFLGPLPHILVCLETIRIDTLNHKTKTKKRLNNKELEHGPDEIANLDDLLTQTNKVNKAAIKLQEQLKPSSAFHERCNSKELRKLVEEANDLISSLPFKISTDLSDDLHLAIKGIVTQPSFTGARKKPMLNDADL